jgi:hypothetical protein
MVNVWKKVGVLIIVLVSPKAVVRVMIVIGERIMQLPLL